MPPETLEVLVDFFKALADASRLQIIGLLAQQERTVEEIATMLELRAPTVSHHLKRLKSLNLVSVRAEGTSRYYKLDEHGLRFLSKEVLQTEAIVSAGGADKVGSFERKVLKAFIKDGKLVQIPSQHKKRAVILNHILELFEWDRRYPEAELNAIIAELHPDTATLRRELIGARLMERERNVYWRV